METIVTRAAASPVVMRSLGGRPVYAPPIPKRPHKSLFGRPSLGAGPKFDVTTIVAGLGGAAAILGSRWADQPAKAILNVAGIAALGFSFYRAFLDVEAEAVAKKPGPTGKPSPVSAPSGNISAYENVTGVISSPRQGSDVEVETGFFSVQATYPVTIVLFNLSREVAPVQYRLYASEKPAYFGTPSAGANQGEVAQGQILLPAEKETTINLVLKPITPAAITASSIEVTLTLQKRSSEKDAWQTLSSITYTLQ